MKRKSNIPEEKLLPYDTICAATRGDPDAMAEVLRHFDGYISLRATRIFYDEYGQSYDSSFAVEDRLFRVRWRKGIDQTAENQPGKHQNKQDRQQKQNDNDGNDLADMLASGPDCPGHSPIGTTGSSALGRAGNRLAGLDGALDRMRCGGRSVYCFSKAVFAFFSHQILSFRLGVGGSFFTMDSL